MSKPRKFYGEAHERSRVGRSCGKTWYRTRAIAEDAKRGQGHQMGEDLRIYGCPECGGFHLSSQLTKRVRPTSTSEPHGLSCRCERCLDDAFGPLSAMPTDGEEQRDAALNDLGVPTVMPGGQR